MSYKGYTLAVEYDDEYGILVGHVMGIRDIISCEGESVAELKLDFRNAIDVYLDVCEKHGTPPDKPVAPQSSRAEKMRSLTSGSPKPRARKQREKVEA